ncbi:MAG: molybdopterin molybdotransferase MoeA [Alphaproteobacteria bacterium]|nr:molybdopterin molybdotransferase MoeA [Alphaproteobacteria bacterium]
MISVEDATARIVAGMHTLGTETVSVSAAMGRVLAEDLAARVTHPPFPVSAMDGYAVRSADVASAPVTLRVIGESAAGHPFAGTLGPGEAVRTFTGAVVCAGADAVVMQENTDAGPGTVRVRAGVIQGTHVRPPGMDFSVGELLLGAGRRLTFRDVGLAAAMNMPWLRVRRRPRIAILSTGDEIGLPGDPVGPGCVFGSNGFALSAYVTSLGGVAIDLGIAGDDRASLLALASGAKGADMLVTSGGVSVGDHDLIQQVLGEAGLKIDFWKVAVRPGKPLVFGHFGDIPLLGLPGNPVSAMVGAVLFLEPALRAMQGLPHRGPRASAVLTRGLEANDSREDYLRATLSHAADGSLRVTPFERQDSAMLATLCRADCLAVRPPNAPPAKPGDRIEIVALDSFCA